MRLAAITCTEPNWQANVANAVRYASNRSSCRRVVISSHFEEPPPPCHYMCDVCARRKGTKAQRDLVMTVVENPSSALKGSRGHKCEENAVGEIGISDEHNGNDDSSDKKIKVSGSEARKNNSKASVKTIQAMESLNSEDAKFKTEWMERRKTFLSPSFAALYRSDNEVSNGIIPSSILNDPDNGSKTTNTHKRGDHGAITNLACKGRNITPEILVILQLLEDAEATDTKRFTLAQLATAWRSRTAKYGKTDLVPTMAGSALPAHRMGTKEECEDYILRSFEFGFTAYNTTTYLRINDSGRAILAEYNCESKRAHLRIVATADQHNDESEFDADFRSKISNHQDTSDFKPESSKCRKRLIVIESSDDEDSGNERREKRKRKKEEIIDMDNQRCPIHNCQVVDIHSEENYKISKHLRSINLPAPPPSLSVIDESMGLIFPSIDFALNQKGEFPGESEDTAM
eukprot:CAMPEP_0175039546 /NCGR_PEP_ID=MMETSP0052_2-20121109/659_1 /TAXON_ID=51329 ORGANISM="Polytomella parva, Strain SAG 63-3" /NCGR_SAMPLE_ID=MMETSP0052_2 /ASSEMBLY_ACC=CAM_ASM_000194 /LENGTH=459 /DNA_ID=CAMNT_0016301441 /DNA_START=68 /DNA_END=1448 /DNA_ORIENTATION=+